MTTRSFLFQSDPPWISIGPEEPDAVTWIPSNFYGQAGLNTCVRVVRGKKMATKAGLMNEFGAAFQFFDGFGENWYALRDCLTLLDEWLPASSYVLIIPDAHLILRDEPQFMLEALLKTLHDCGERWAKPVEDNGRFNRAAVAFQTLLVLSPQYPADRDRFEAATAASGSAVRFLADVNVPPR